ncbi:MAG: PHP domain-containing protein, partial [Acidobacteriota bacterium]
MHTTTSDGHGTHDEVAEAAIRAGLDFIVITDHNTLPLEFEGYYYRGFDRILRLIGEEVHDLARSPERSHLLIYGTEIDLSPHADRPQSLIREVQKRGGLSFLAHPCDCGVPEYD